MINGSIVLDVPPEQVDLNDLTTKIQTLLKAKRWEDDAQKRGFSGLDMDAVEVNGERRARILVIWSNDGVNGFVKEDLTAAQIANAAKLISRRNG